VTVPPIVNPVPVPVPPVEVELAGNPLHAARATAAASNCAPKISFSPDFIMSCSFKVRGVLGFLQMAPGRENSKIQLVLSAPDSGERTHPHEHRENAM
jgi:hypothetical protein